MACFFYGFKKRWYNKSNKHKKGVAFLGKKGKMENIPFTLSELKGKLKNIPEIGRSQMKEIFGEDFAYQLLLLGNDVRETLITKIEDKLYLIPVGLILRYAVTFKVRIDQAKLIGIEDLKKIVHYNKVGIKRINDLETIQKQKQCICYVLESQKLRLLFEEK
jgi:hypothetical protein